MKTLALGNGGREGRTETPKASSAQDQISAIATEERKTFLIPRVLYSSTLHPCPPLHLHVKLR